MKSKSKTIAGALMLATVITVVTIMSCNKHNLNVPDPAELTSQMEAKTSLLLNKMKTSQNEHSEYEVLRKEYAALSPAELGVFHALKLKSDSLQLVKEFDGNQALVSERVSFLKALRDEVHSKCISMFDKQVNKLTYQEVAKAIDAAKQKFIPARTPENLKAAAALACPKMAYYWSTSRTTYTGRFQYGWGRADNNPDITPCDYEFYFDGPYYHRVKDHNYDSWEVMNNYNWVVSYRRPSYNDGLDTAILLGYFTVHYYSSGAGALSFSMDFLA